MAMSLSSRVLGVSLVAFAFAPAACSSGSSSEPGGDVPACGAGGTIVLDGTLDGKPVAQTLASQGYFLDQISNPKSAKVTFVGGRMDLGWATLVADGASAPLTSGALQLPGETVDRIANSGVIYKGTDELRASLTFATGKVGACLKRTR